MGCVVVRASSEDTVVFLLVGFLHTAPQGQHHHVLRVVRYKPGCSCWFSLTLASSLEPLEIVLTRSLPAWLQRAELWSTLHPGLLPCSGHAFDLAQGVCLGGSLSICALYPVGLQIQFSCLLVLVFWQCFLLIFYLNHPPPSLVKTLLFLDFKI